MTTIRYKQCLLHDKRQPICADCCRPLRGSLSRRSDVRTSSALPATGPGRLPSTEGDSNQIQMLLEKIKYEASVRRRMPECCTKQMLPYLEIGISMLCRHRPGWCESQEFQHVLLIKDAEIEFSVEILEPDGYWGKEEVFVFILRNFLRRNSYGIK